MTITTEKKHYFPSLKIKALASVILLIVVFYILCYNFTTTLWGKVLGYEVPLAGYADIEFTIYAQDRNCWPWKIAPWWVTGMENVLATKIDENTLSVRIFVTLLTLHGTGKVTLSSVSSAGGPITNYEIPLAW
ncbi:MAG: hypothetical protein HUU41_19835 [Bryobacteraceae bacterium]|nr:hypothetical protein [Bryobacteraceae bacterium]